MQQIVRLQQHPGIRVFVINYILIKYKIKTSCITLKIKSRTHGGTTNNRNLYAMNVFD